MIVGPKDLQGHMVTGISMLLLYLLIGNYAIGLKTSGTIYLFVIISCIEVNEACRIIPHLREFYRKSKTNESGNAAKQCIKSAFKQYFTALLYFTTLPCIIAIIAKLVLSFGTNINRGIFPFIPVFVIYISFVLAKLLYKYDSKEIEFNYYKNMAQLDPTNVVVYYHLAALSAIMMKTEECLSALKVVVKLDKKYIELAREDKAFGINNIRNTDEFKEIVR